MSPYIAYCRGRVRPALSAEEVERYFCADLPVVVGFVIGSIDSEAEGKRLPSEAEVEAEVARRLEPGPAETPPDPPAAPPAVPAHIEDAETQRVRPAPFIGAPLPARGI